MKEAKFLEIIRWQWHSKFSGHSNIWKVVKDGKTYLGCSTCDEDNGDQLAKKINEACGGELGKPGKPKE